jgi:BioD-like phosphotransacetylase family protein
MVPLYITSTERYAGKKLITVGLIARLIRDGFKVGYFKPMGRSPMKTENILTDKGAWLIWSLFELKDPIEKVCPVIITRDLILQNFKKDLPGTQQKIADAFETISHEKDVVVIGCDSALSEGSSFGASGAEIVKQLNASALFVQRYTKEHCIDLLLEQKKAMGNAMIGATFNKVSSVDLDDINELAVPFLSRKDVEIYGSIPEDALLKSLWISDLADHLDADVVCGKDHLDSLVANFLVGGMQVDKFISYLLKRPASGIIVGGDRTDIQLVAIENDVKCLILSGSLYPNDTIVARAETKGVPILVVKEDTYTVAKNVEAMVGQFKPDERERLNHGIQLVDEAFDFKRLYQALDLTSS